MVKNYDVLKKQQHNFEHLFSAVIFKKEFFNCNPSLGSIY